jgi:hypothetical protein
MATYLTRNGRVTALIRQTGPDGKKRSAAKTFSSQEEAEGWAADFVKLRRSVDRHDAHLHAPNHIYKLTRHPATIGLCGIYFLFLKNECVYVGQSTNIHVRIRDHRLPGLRAKDFETFSYLEVPRDSLEAVEAYYIAMFNPKFNITMNPGITSRRNAG